VNIREAAHVLFVVTVMWLDYNTPPLHDQSSPSPKRTPKTKPISKDLGNLITSLTYNPSLHLHQPHSHTLLHLPSN